MATIEVKGVTPKSAKQLDKSIKMILSANASDTVKLKALEIIQKGLTGGSLNMTDCNIYSKPA